MESPESDAIAYESTFPAAIIFQLKQRIQNVRKIYGTQESFTLQRLNNAHQIFLKAQKKWEETQTDFERRLNILQGRRDEEIYRLEMKIRRYRILERYGTGTWTRAFTLARKYQDSPEDLETGGSESQRNASNQNFESDSKGDSEEVDLEQGIPVEQQIARDLLDNKLGIWFSSDMEEWGEVIGVSNRISPEPLKEVIDEDISSEDQPLDMV